MSDFQDLVRVSAEVASTRSRRRKIEYISDYLRRLPAEAVSPAVAYLSGVIPQGAVGVGWATLRESPSPAGSASLRVTEVAETFDRLLEVVGKGSQTRRRELVEGLMRRATESEQRFIVALLTGDLRQGALEGSMIEAVAAAGDVPVEAVRRATMFSGRIWEVAELAISGGQAALDAVELTLFRPVKPMLAQTAESVVEALERVDDQVAVEWKLDGIRVQVHRQGDRVAVYTRNLNQVTERLEEIAADVRRLPCHSVVLDGEAIVLDESGRPARFQETAGRFGTEVMETRGLQAFYFDLLHIDGEDVTDRPLIERRARLEALVGDRLIPQTITTDPAEAEGVLAEALEFRHEGVMVKAASSPYEAGRRGAAWLKVKPVHTLDLVVLGAEWGHGRRTGWLSNLHLGARAGEEFLMVGKTFKGMTDEILTWQTERLQDLEVRRTKGAVFVRPELVVEIALDGVQVSTRYPGGVALRFARLRGYRPDKDPAETDTIDTLREMAGLPPLGQ